MDSPGDPEGRTSGLSLQCYKSLGGSFRGKIMFTFYKRSLWPLSAVSTGKPVQRVSEGKGWWLG